MTEPLLLSTTRISTFRGKQLLTAATAFFFRRSDRLYLVTSRHVLHDPPTGHFPDRIEMVLHVDPQNLTRTEVLSVPLYKDGLALWRQGRDSFGDVDVAVIPLDRGMLPGALVLHAFEPEHLLHAFEEAEVGAHLLVVGFPLGFYDTVHYLPDALPDVVMIPVGAFADPSFQWPQVSMYESRKHAWVHVPDGIENH